MIISSAIKITETGRVYTGKRHHNIIQDNKGVNFKGKNREDVVQGFVDQTGKFYNRKEAYEYVIKCGQLQKDTNLIGSVLTSEDLW